MKTHTDNPFPASMTEACTAEVAVGTRVLGLTPDDEPATIVSAIDAFVFNWQCGERPPPSVLDPEKVPVMLGAVWGQQFVREFGWEWAIVEFHEHDGMTAPAVLSPDRSLAVYPIHFIMGCLQDSTVDTTILVAFKMLAARRIGDTTPGSYFNLMEGVHRIIPRIATPKS